MRKNKFLRVIACQTSTKITEGAVMKESKTSLPLNIKKNIIPAVTLVWRWEIIGSGI